VAPGKNLGMTLEELLEETPGVTIGKTLEELLDEAPGEKLDTTLMNLFDEEGGDKLGKTLEELLLTADAPPASSAPRATAGTPLLAALATVSAVTTSSTERIDS
jgi:hypothetical protein